MTADKIYILRPVERYDYIKLTRFYFPGVVESLEVIELPILLHEEKTGAVYNCQCDFIDKNCRRKMYYITKNYFAYL